MTKTCEFCGAPATCYGGFPGAGSWAGWVCDPCAASVYAWSWVESVSVPLEERLAPFGPDGIDPTDHTWASAAETEEAFRTDRV